MPRVINSSNQEIVDRIRDNPHWVVVIFRGRD